MPPIIDLIIRIKNGYMAGRQSIDSPYSKFRESILKKIQKLGYIKGYEVIEEDGKKYVLIHLVYSGKKPAVTDVKIFSKPGRRMYITYKEMKPVLGGLGYSIISTSKGIMTNIEAKKQQMGGELLFNIW